MKIISSTIYDLYICSLALERVASGLIHFLHNPSNIWAEIVIIPLLIFILTTLIMF